MAKGIVLYPEPPGKRRDIKENLAGSGLFTVWNIKLSDHFTPNLDTYGHFQA